MPDDELLALDEALDHLAAVDTRAAEMVKLCFFVGLTQAQAAQELGISLGNGQPVNLTVPLDIAHRYFRVTAENALPPMP